MKKLIIAAILVVALCATGGWFGYWWMAKASQNNRYDVNTHSQQYQAGLIAQLRDKAAGWDAAVDTAQKTQIAESFCALYVDLTQPPSDLQSAHIRIC